MLPWWIKNPYQNEEIMNLDWIISHFEEFINDINSLKDWRSEHETQYEELLALYQEVKTDWDNFAAGIWPTSVYNAMKAWWEANAIDLVGSLVKMVFFGLTADGHFIAYIPENWSDITFDTIMDASDPNYGCLTLSY